MRLGRGTTVLWCRERCWECKVAPPSFCLCTSIWTGDRGRPSRVRSSHSLFFFLSPFFPDNIAVGEKKRTRDRRERERGKKGSAGNTKFLFLFVLMEWVEASRRRLVSVKRPKKFLRYFFSQIFFFLFFSLWNSSIRFSLEGFLENLCLLYWFQHGRSFPL